jgi:chromosomal replication initiator protein
MKTSSAPASEALHDDSGAQLDLSIGHENVAKSGTAAHAQPDEIMRAAWQQAMDVLQSELSAPAYNNYLRHITPTALLDDRLILSAPSDFVKDWLVRRFGKRIEETLEQFLGKPIVLAFQISPSEIAPSALVGIGSTPDVEGAPLPERAVEVREPEPQAPPDTKLSLPRNENAATKYQKTEGGKNANSENRPAPRARAVRDLSDLEDFSSSPLNKKYTFDNFIVGRSNYVSHAAAWAVANAPAKGQYNPLFIYGGVGLGKTHVMQAIGHYVNSQRPNPMEIVYVSGENFLYQVVRCIREDRMTAFRRMYRNVDIWLVDDIQYICNAERTEVEFFHIFNTLYDQGKQIVICSDKPPKELELTENRLISRFEWGLITYMEPPDLEHRIAILQKRAQAEGVQVDPAVLQYLAEKIRSNIRSLEGALTRLLAMSSLDGRKINIDLASETVRYYSTAEADPIKIDVDTIIQVVSEHFKMPVADILGKKRNKEIVLPRQVAMYLAREMGQMSYPDIGRAFGRDYTTVIHSYEKIKTETKKDAGLKNVISEIRSRAHARA